MSDTSASRPLKAYEGNAGLTARAGTFLSDAQEFYAQPGVQRALPSIAAAIVIVFGLLLYVALQTPDRTTLFASLPEAEKARVIESLQNAGMDVQIDPATGELTVPVSDYHSAKLRLASEGLPTMSPDGYTMLNDMPMGTSRSVENMRLKQTQEVELARSINEIDVINASRVHLAIPERSAFARNAQQPTASVFVQLAQGRSLSAEQVAAIVNLVSSSVPNLPKSGVTVVDQNGRLLSDSIDDPAATLSEHQLNYRLRLENIYRTRIESLLTPLAGPGNVSAQVSLDIDFTRREVTEDIVLPNSSAILSEQVSREEEMSRPARGVPGAVSNSPPAEATLVSPAAPDDGDGAAEDGNGNGAENETLGGPQSQLRPQPVTPAANEAAMLRSSNDLRNFEVSRQVSTESAPTAQIRRIHVAVLLRDRPAAAAEGAEQPTSAGLTEDERAELERLVTSAMGLDMARGDMLTITSRPFVSESLMMDGVTDAWYDDPFVQDMVQKIMTLLIITVVAMGVVRPLLTRLLMPAAGDGTMHALDGDDGDLSMDTIEVQEGQSLEEIKAKLKPKKTSISAEMLDTANSYDDKVALIRMIVADEAGRVSNVFKAMMQRDLETMN